MYCVRFMQMMIFNRIVYEYLIILLHALPTEVMLILTKYVYNLDFHILKNIFCFFADAVTDDNGALRLLHEF